MITAEELVIEIDNSGESKNFKLATVVELFENDTAKIKFDGEDTPSEKQYAYLDSYAPNTNDRVLLGVLGGTYVILGKVNYNVGPSTEEEVDRYLFDLKKVIMQKGLKVTLGAETDTLTVNNGATIVGNVGVNGSVTATGVSSTGAVTGSSLNVTGEVKGNNLDVAGQVKGQSLSIANAISVNGLTTSGQLRHIGASVGFFNTTPQTRPTGTPYSTLPSSATIEQVIDKLNLYINLLKRYGLSS